MGGVRLPSWGPVSVRLLAVSGNHPCAAARHVQECRPSACAEVTVYWQGVPRASTEEPFFLPQKCLSEEGVRTGGLGDRKQTGLAVILEAGPVLST